MVRQNYTDFTFRIYSISVWVLYETSVDFIKYCIDTCRLLHLNVKPNIKRSKRV